MQNKTTNIRKLTGTAMLGAVAAVLMYMEFPIPIMPSFVKLDVSELPALLAAKPGTVLDTPFVTKTGYVIAKVNESKPQTVKPLDAVKDDIKASSRTRPARSPSRPPMPNARPLPPLCPRNFRASSRRPNRSAVRATWASWA